MRALVVVDAQREYVDGRLPIAHPPIESSLAAIGRAMAAARAASMPMIVVRHVEAAGAPVFAADGTGVALAAEVAAHPADAVVDKTFPSSFTGTDLAERLEALGVDRLVVCGYMTQHCVQSTARDAAHRGYAVEVLADACGAPDLDNALGAVDGRTLHESVLVELATGFAAVLDTDAWIAAVAAGDTPAPLGLLSSIRPR